MQHRGSCLCGAVAFDVAGELPAGDACHCTRCRKHTGHYLASVDVKKAALTVHGGASLRWYASSPKVNRGFCGVCGSTLLFDPPHLDWIGVSLGAFDGSTGTRVALHSFVADKGDYYDICDGVPQNAQ